MLIQTNENVKITIFEEKNIGKAILVLVKKISKKKKKKMKKESFKHACGKTTFYQINHSYHL